jgi:hemerythrin
MRLFRWSKAHAVFVPEIDDEHRAIFRIADELQQAVDSEAPQFQVLEILHRLIAQAEDHFTHEESLMRSLRYPAFEWHRQQHETVRKRARKFVPQIEAGDPEAATLLIGFLSQWLKEHTGLADRMMGAYVRNQNRLHHAA